MHEKTGHGNVAADLRTLRGMTRHFTRWVGAPDRVFHEARSSLVHVDVHVVPAPFADARGAILYTTGMSDREMAVPRFDCDCRPPDRVEIMMHLPSSWRFDDAAMKDPRWAWPVQTLRDVAHYVHAHSTWIGWGHTIPNGNPPEPFAPDTRFSSVIVLPPTSLPPWAHRATMPGGRRVAIYALYPLLLDEMELKLEEGADALVDQMERAGVSDEYEPDRSSVVSGGGARRDRSRPTRSGSNGASSS